MLLLSTLALAQDPAQDPPPAPVQSTAPVQEAVPAQPQPTSADYLRGFELGLTQGKQVPAGDFVLYGAGATFVASAVGCCGATAAGYLMEPGRIPPRSGNTIPDAADMVAIPSPPPGVDPQQWAHGYAAGWTKGLQKKRAGRAFLGGSGLTLVTAGVAAVTVVVLYGGLIIALQGTGLYQEPLTAGAP